MKELIGYSAIITGSISFLPQITQIIKTKKARDINYMSLILNISSCFLYIIYGSMKKDNIVIISVISPICVQLIIIYFIFKYKNINDISNNLQIEDNTINI